MTSKTCPFLGLLEDAETALNYPTAWNYCHRAKPVEPVSPEHQQTHCLTAEYQTCPVFQRKKAAALPKTLRTPDLPVEIKTQQRASTIKRYTPLGIGFFSVLIVGGILLAGFLGLFTGAGFLNTPAATTTQKSPPTQLPAGQENPIPTALLPAPTTEAGIIANGETPANPAASATPAATQPTEAAPASCLSPPGWASIRVQSGDTLPALAQAYGISVEELAQVNCLTADSTLVPGSIFYVPHFTPTPTITCGAPAGWVQYTVQAKDTLYQLSQLFGVSVAQIQLANCMGSATLISVGQRLYVPNVPTQTPVPPSATPVPSATSAPTNTPTLTPAPTATFTSTPAPSDTPTPEPYP